MAAPTPSPQQPPVPSSPSASGRIRELLYGSAAAFLWRVLGAGAAVGVQIYVARKLGEDAFGEYAFALAMLSILGLLARMGLGTGLLRFIGQYLAQDAKGHLAGLILVSFLAVFFVSGLFSLTGFWALDTWGSDLPPGRITALKAAAWLLPPLALMGIAQAILVGFQRIGPAIFTVQIVRPGLLVLALFMLIALGGLSPTAVTALQADTVAVSLTVVALTILVAVTVRYRVDWQGLRLSTREWFLVSLPLMLMTGLQVLFNQTDIIMLGSLTTSGETGIYAAAARVSRLVLFGLTAINAVAAPMIARSYHSGRIDEMRGVLDFISRILLVFTLAMVLIFAVAGRDILNLFGPGFASAWGPLLILVLGQAYNSLSGPVAYLLTMTGHQKVAARIVAFSALGNLCLNAVLIPPWGIWGAAIATTISIVVWNTWMIISAQRLVGLNPSVFRRW